MKTYFKAILFVIFLHVLGAAIFIEMHQKEIIDRMAAETAVEQPKPASMGY